MHNAYEHYSLKVLGVEVIQVMIPPEVKGELTRVYVFFLFWPGDVGLHHYSRIPGETGYAVIAHHTQRYEGFNTKRW